MSKRRIGILGGTFNPIHFGHLRTAEEAKESLGLDTVLFVPSFEPPFEKRNLASFKHRITMVRLAIRGNVCFEVSDIEKKICGKSYTFHTVSTLRERYPDDKLVFIMGTDAFLELPQWYNPGGILSLVDIAVIVRPPSGPEDLKNSPFLKNVEPGKLSRIDIRKKVTFSAGVKRGRVIVLRTPPLDISATRIRSMIKKGKSIKYLLPQTVYSYTTY